MPCGAIIGGAWCKALVRKRAFCTPHVRSGVKVVSGLWEVVRCRKQFVSASACGTEKPRTMSEQMRRALVEF